MGSPAAARPREGIAAAVDTVAAVTVAVVEDDDAADGNDAGMGGDVFADVGARGD